MSKFKAGDRVAIYFGGERVVGTVVGFHDGREDMMDVDPGRSNYHLPPVHPKQCRRLVKVQRRRWTLSGTIGVKDEQTFVQTLASGPGLRVGETVEVIEVRRKP